MKTRRAPGMRLLGYATAMALAFVLTGDYSQAVGVPASVYGQDPLEVLELKVRPNVFVVLDSSGSMTETLQYPAANTYDVRSGDHPRSKMRLAKEVLRGVIANNETKVSFLFGQYTQANSSASNTAAGSHRFQYTANNDSDMSGFPSMNSTELTVQRAQGDSFGRGLQSWQDIRPAWGTLYFDEDASGGGSIDAVCAATLTGLPRFYRQGSDLATDLANAMNSASCTTGSRTNIYSVAYSTANGRFTFTRTGGTRQWRILWGKTPNNIRNALAETSTSTTGWTTTGTISTDAPWTLLYRNSTTTNSGNGIGSGTGQPGTPNAPWKFTETVDPDGQSGPLAARVVTFYNLRAGRMFNGETIKVLADGTVCDLVYPVAPLPVPLPELSLQQVSACGGTDVGTPVSFGWGGARFLGNNISCNGFSAKVPLIPCDLQSPPAPTQVSTISPFIDYEFTFNPDGTPQSYVESQDGGWQATTAVLNTASAKANGATPVANSLRDIKTLFGTSTTTGLWGAGQAGATTMAGPPPYQLDPIRSHRDPKEKTIVLFVTDGDDTCAGQGDNDRNALAAAYRAELLYQRIEAAQPASSVQTYVIGFGNGAAPYRLNWIAWGGSGLGNPAVGNNGARWTPAFSGSYFQDCRAGSQCESINNALAPQRSACSSCTDAFIAPDPATLAAQLQSIIDQGASDGEFTAQQSITESVFEYLDPATLLGTPPTAYDASDPRTRYGAIVPTRFVSSFTLPGFKGQLKAYQNDGAGNSLLMWSAGDKLWHLVSSAMSGTNCPATGGAGAGECAFTDIAGAGAAAIQRRIYTTDRNGVYPFSPDTLIDAGSGATPSNRVNLWPPQATVAPADYATEGILDVELGLPADSTANAAADFTDLQNRYRACLGTNLPAACASATPLVRMQAARREARELVLAFMAGAAPVPATGVTGLKRSSGAVRGSPAQSLVYTARSWVLADSEMATAAVITPPQLNEPSATPYVFEYGIYTKGPRDGAGSNPGTSAQIKQGVGLANPDDDATPGSPASLEPVMTVAYAPANDMLHAFRAGPNVPGNSCVRDATPANPVPVVADAERMNAARDCGGEELWGFVPYDQLASVSLRYVHEPQGRDNHVYMLARGIRFGDVFVPGTVTRNLAGAPPPAMQGVWRRVMYFGRGIGGKYVTALDVTGPGSYTERYFNTIGPIPLWNRGNPDTQNGLVGGPDNNPLTPTDRPDYAKMGETWSIPTLAYVNRQRSNAVYQTDRRPTGIDFAIFMGSGYGGVGEGTTHYTLDALSGDVVAAVDVGSRLGFTTYPNALVANSVSFNRVIGGLLSNAHPWSFESARIYIGDLHGRLWKFLTDNPTVAIPVADLGDGQAVATAVALIASSEDPNSTEGPFVFVSSGADRRAAGPFRNFTFLDKATDVDGTVTGTVLDDGVLTYEPVVKQFARTFDQGSPEANCGYTREAVFRGTVQPAGAFECTGTISGGKCNGTVLWRVFFAGTRLSLPNTVFAPPTPLACGSGQYPCRSQFDSIIYALGAVSGAAAYDLNSGAADDAYRVFRDSRIAAITMQADPNPGAGGSSFAPDEGLMKGVPKPPPPPGVPPTATTSTANVVFAREPGKPAPAIRYGTTVCQ